MYPPNSRNLQNDLQKSRLKMKQHEDNIEFLRAQIDLIKDSIPDLQVTIEKYQKSTDSITEKEDARRDEGICEYINQEKSAAGLIFHLKACEIPDSCSPLVKDVIGIVATLGNVKDENLSRLLAEYVGEETMLSLVCKTFDGAEAMETYDKGGVINKNSGLHGIGSSTGRTLEGPFNVICLDGLRPYVGNFLAGDPQRRLDLLRPKLPSGEVPRGFIGYAVNLIYIDPQNLSCVSTSGHGLRETLFYHIFSHLQVYKTTKEMHEALRFIKDGAVSLDGGIKRSPGIFDIGREEVQVKFPRFSGKLSLPENYYEIGNDLKSKKWNQERLLDDMRREQSLLDQAKFNYEIKKKEFARFLAQSSHYAPPQYAPMQQQQQSPAGREGLTHGGS